jgi:type III pantothenate kinase
VPGNSPGIGEQKIRPMNVVIDYGNSSAKIGIFEKRTLIESFSIRESDELREFLNNFSGKEIIISSVNQNSEDIAGWATNFKRAFILGPQLPLPVKNMYGSPMTLGMDRLAGVCGAFDMFPGTNCLVIDAGTCITYDFIDLTGSYFGGGISPGLHMRFKAMHHLTVRLPLVEVVDDPPLVGDSTVTCMQSGAILGATDEIDGMIRRYSEKYGDLRVILCGGDTAFFENKLKASIFAVPELVLSGLNSILLYNAKR